MVMLMGWVMVIDIGIGGGDYLFCPGGPPWGCGGWIRFAVRICLRSSCAETISGGGDGGVVGGLLLLFPAPPALP